MLVVDLIRAASTISAQFGGSTQQVVNELMHLEGSTIQGRTELGVALQSVLDAQRFVGNQLTTVGYQHQF